MENAKTIKRKSWTKEETRLFLKCYSMRKEEFQHARKKRYAYENVLRDMMSRGFPDKTVLEKSLEGRMRTLLSAYKCALCARVKNNGTPKTFTYMDEMEEIFGNDPSISEEVSQPETSQHESSQNETDTDEDYEQPASPSAPSTPSSLLCNSPVTEEPAPKRRRRKTAKAKYYEGKLEIERAAEKRKMQQANAHARRLERLIELKKQQLELDAKKVELLKKILQ